MFLHFRDVLHVSPVQECCGPNLHHPLLVTRFMKLIEKVYSQRVTSHVLFTCQPAIWVLTAIKLRIPDGPTPCAPAASAFHGTSTRRDRRSTTNQPGRPTILEHREAGAWHGPWKSSHFQPNPWDILLGKRYPGLPAMLVCFKLGIPTQNVRGVKSQSPH